MHYVQRAAEKKVYDEQDLTVAMLLMELREKKFTLEAIKNVMTKSEMTRPFPDDFPLPQEYNGGNDLEQLRQEMRQHYQELEKKLIERFDQRYEELQQNVLKRLPSPTSSTETSALDQQSVLKSSAFMIKLEDEALAEWNKLPEEKRYRKVGGFLFKRKEEDLAGRDAFIKKYVREHVNEGIKKEGKSDEST